MQNVFQILRQTGEQSVVAPVVREVSQGERVDWQRLGHRQPRDFYRRLEKSLLHTRRPPTGRAKRNAATQLEKRCRIFPICSVDNKAIAGLSCITFIYYNFGNLLAKHN